MKRHINLYVFRVLAFLIIFLYSNINAQNFDDHRIEINSEKSLINLLYSNTGYSISNFVVLKNHILFYSEYSNVFVLLDKETHIQAFTLEFTKLPKLSTQKVPFHLLDGSTILLETPYSLLFDLNLNILNDSTVSTGIVKYKGKECLMKLLIRDSTIKPLYEEIDFNFPLNKKETVSKSEFKDFLDLYDEFHNNHIYSFSIQSPFLSKKNKNEINSNLLIAYNPKKKVLDTLFLNPNEAGLMNGNSFVIQNNFLLYSALQLDTLIIFDKELTPVYKGKILNVIPFPELIQENSIVFNELLQDKWSNKVYINTIVLSYEDKKIESYDYYISRVSINEDYVPSFEYLFKITSETDLTLNSQLYNEALYFRSRADVFDNYNSYNIYSIQTSKIPKNEVIEIKLKIHSTDSFVSSIRNTNKEFTLLKKEDRIKLFNGIAEDTILYPQNTTEELIKSIKKCIKESKMDYFFSYLMLMESSSYREGVEKLATEKQFTFLVDKLNLLIKYFDKNLLNYNDHTDRWELDINNTTFYFNQHKNSWYLIGTFTNY